MTSAYEWAAEEFGHAELGDARRTQRLVAIAAESLARPSGLITRVADSSASREGAYRFVENDAVDIDRLGGAMFAACARRLVGATNVIVAVDQSTLSFVDSAGKKGLGPVNGVENPHRLGFEVMSALAVLPDGQSIGLLAQDWHVRSAERSPTLHRDKRPIEQRESGLWHCCIGGALDTLREHAPGVRPWFQLDRGGDIGHVLVAASQLDADFTFRACWDRKLDTGGYLRRAVRSTRCLGIA